MVKKLFWYIRNPIFLSAVICAIILYSHLIPVAERNPFCSGLVSFDSLRGTVCSNPVRNSSGKYYSITVNVTETGSHREDGTFLRGSACGKLNCLVPSSAVESLYPGKLYSKSRDGGFLSEIGEEVVLSGKMKADSSVFVASRALNDEGASFWEKESSEKSFFSKIMSYLLHRRSRLRLAFKRLMWSWGDAGGLVLSLLCGSREYLENGLQDLFKKAGLSHILALSGMHLSFFGGLASGVGKKILGQKHSWLFTLVGITLFVFFVGFTPSLTRSFLFSLTMLIIGFTGFGEIKSLAVLSFVFLLHIVLNPQDMFQVSFLLSYGALVGIFSLSGILEIVFTRCMPNKLASGIGASVGAQASTCPISISVFGEVMPIGIIASVAVSPLVSIFMTFSLASVAISLVMPFLSNVFGDIIGIMYGLIKACVGLFALCPSIRI